MACVLCAMLSKEQGITALGFCVVYDFVSFSQVSGREEGRWGGGRREGGKGGGRGGGGGGGRGEGMRERGGEW